MKKPVLHEEPAGWTRPPKHGGRREKSGSKASTTIGSSTITDKGQTTIPKDVRKRLGLNPGTRLDYVVGTDGTVQLRAAALTIDDIYGCLPKPAKPVSVEEMNRAIRRRAAAGK